MKTDRQVKVKKPVTRWKRALETIAADPELNSSAKFVYAVLAIHSYDGKCSMGARLLGVLAGMSKSVVAASVQDLRERRHIRTSPGAFNRNEFELLAMAKEPVEVAAGFGIGLLSNIAICPKCHEVIDMEKHWLVKDCPREEVA